MKGVKQTFISLSLSLSIKNSMPWSSGKGTVNDLLELKVTLYLFGYLLRRSLVAYWLLLVPIGY